MNAGNANLAIPCVDSAAHLFKNIGDRPRTSSTTRSRNDAVAAPLVASGLNAQGQRGSSCDARFEREAARGVAAAEPLCGGQFAFGLEQAHQRILAAIRDDAHDIWKLTDFLRPSRPVATGDKAPHSEVGAGNSPDGLPRSLIGGRSYWAGGGRR